MAFDVSQLIDVLEQDVTVYRVTRGNQPRICRYQSHEVVWIDLAKFVDALRQDQVHPVVVVDEARGQVFTHAANSNQGMQLSDQVRQIVQQPKNTISTQTVVVKQLDSLDELCETVTELFQKTQTPDTSYSAAMRQLFSNVNLISLENDRKHVSLEVKANVLAYTFGAFLSDTIIEMARDFAKAREQVAEQAQEEHKGQIVLRAEQKYAREHEEVAHEAITEKSTVSQGCDTAVVTRTGRVHQSVVVS